MLSKEVKVNCITDENVKWTTYLVQTSNNYASSVRIKHNGYDTNAKSLLGVLSIKLSNGEVVTITADGADEKEAVEYAIECVEKICEIKEIINE